MEDESIDCIVTDPPYGYSFMGKDWDKAVIPVPYWKECLRVLKSGAFAFIMSSPRQDVLGKIISNLTEAGFNMGFTSLYWTYASGFPKAGNIGKMVDKRLGSERKDLGKKSDFSIDGATRKGETHQTVKEVGKKIGHKYGFGNAWESRVTKGHSPLEGSYGGFQPKPAVEIILVCMKPLSEKTYVDQALKNRKGITWLDDCRIPITNNNE